MKIDKIMEVIKSLSSSQGVYSRLYAQLCEIKQTDKSLWNKISLMLEQQNFKSPVDVVMWLEN